MKVKVTFRKRKDGTLWLYNNHKMYTITAGGSFYHVSCDGLPLGTFGTMKEAKAKVERAIG